MTITERFSRVSARFAACALLLAGVPCAAYAQAAAEPAELPPLEVTAKKAPAKKTAAKKAKTTPKAAAPAQSAASPLEEGRPAGVTNAAAPVTDYVATEATTATKTGTPLRETPQSISVAGREQMRDQGVQNLQEALRYMPGVIADPWGYDSRYDNIMIRGIAATHYIDGLRTTYGFGSSSAMIEPYSLERVDVLRGPSSMLYGQTPTGGIVNGVSKLPSEIAYREIGVEYGSFDFKQVKLDMTGPATEDGKWLYRIVGLARDADTQVDFVENDRLMLAPSLTYRPTNNTSITVLGNFRDDHSGSTLQFLPHAGTLTPNVNDQRVRRSTFVGEPDDYYDTESQSVSVIADHKFSEDLKLHHISRYAHTETGYDTYYAAPLSPLRFSVLNGIVPVFDPTHAPFLDADETLIGRARTLQFTDADVFNSDTNLTATFSTGNVHHKVTGGFDYMRFNANVSTSGVLVDNLPQLGQAPFDIYNPVYGQSLLLLSPFLALGGDPFPFVPSDAVPLEARPEETQTQAGIYIQDQLRLGPWLAVLGVRQDWLTIEEAGAPDVTDTATTWRAALMYEFSSGFSPYVSYSTSFLPIPGQPVGTHMFSDLLGGTTRPAGPIEGEQVEIGFKYQPPGVPLMINAALYELTDKNQIVQPDFLFDGVQGADVNVRGFELEAIGKVTRELKIIGSYSYTDATYEKYPELFPFPFEAGFPDIMKGKRVDGVPEHMASLWAIYGFQDGALKGLSFGGGVRYVGASESHGVDINLDPLGFPVAGAEVKVKTPSFTLFDAMVSYETDDWRWQLTGQNLADKYHVTTCSVYRGDCGVGQGRTIITGFTYKF